MAGALADDAFLAIVDHGHHDVPWAAELAEVIRSHSRSPDFDPSFTVPAALASAGLLEISGRARTAPVPIRQSVDSYVEQFHSTSSLAREWMQPQESAAFRAAIIAIVAPYAADGVITMDVVAEVVWGRPRSISLGS